jgi:hypothetical protein
MFFFCKFCFSFLFLGYSACIGTMSMGIDLLTIAFGLDVAGLNFIVGTESYISFKSSKKLKEHTENLVKALDKEKECFEEFQKDLEAIDSSVNFSFDLHLKNEARSYIGIGKSGLHQITSKALPPLDKVKIKDEEAKKMLQFLLNKTNDGDKGSTVKGKVIDILATEISRLPPTTVEELLGEEESTSENE